MGRLLAIDHGERRIGLAISDPNKIISKPLTTLLMSDINILYNKLLEIVAEYDIEKLIILICFPYKYQIQLYLESITILWESNLKDRRKISIILK